MNGVSQSRRQKTLAGQAGYSLTEMMMVVGIMGVVIGIAVVQIGSSRAGLKGDGAMRVVLSQLNQARELAITQRRNMRVEFNNGTTVVIKREEVPWPPLALGPTLTTLTSVPFEGGLQFLRIAALGDTPDAFGYLTELAFPAGTTQMRFAPDGTFINQDGATFNGTVFTALPNQNLSARAVSVFGSTGRVRGFRWDGKGWKPV